MPNSDALNKAIKRYYKVNKDQICEQKAIRNFYKRMEMWNNDWTYSIGYRRH